MLFYYHIRYKTSLSTQYDMRELNLFTLTQNVYRAKVSDLKVHYYHDVICECL